MLAQHDHQTAHAAVAHHQIRAVADHQRARALRPRQRHSALQLLRALRKEHHVRRPAHAERGMAAHRLIHQHAALRKFGDGII